MGTRSGISSSKQKTPKCSASQKSSGSPIIAVPALLKLAKWYESLVNLASGGATEVHHDEADFEAELAVLLQSTEDPTVLLPSIVVLIRRFWTFEGDPDESVFDEVIDFRERQGKN